MRHDVAAGVPGAAGDRERGVTPSAAPTNVTRAVRFHLPIFAKALDGTSDWVYANGSLERE